ncbi:hypothetical protein M501DRAFT_874244 [Patellaria atrata CBS 101060]|uniref:Uncharacterized protein n=1 Tax=Patellaria atrata CBS 101060 TaxID=1346257 RepID=A0A9P4S955_9PEZI|nr:hypothetical protein M501DRAFT_874244 [Patellaria atrata CBS 101060]
MIGLFNNSIRSVKQSFGRPVCTFILLPNLTLCEFVVVTVPILDRTIRHCVSLDLSHLHIPGPPLLSTLPSATTHSSPFNTNKSAIVVSFCCFACPLCVSSSRSSIFAAFLLYPYVPASRVYSLLAVAESTALTEIPTANKLARISYQKLLSSSFQSLPTSKAPSGPITCDNGQAPSLVYSL